MEAIFDHAALTIFSQIAPAAGRSIQYEGSFCVFYDGDNAIRVIYSGSSSGSIAQELSKNGIGMARPSNCDHSILLPLHARSDPYSAINCLETIFEHRQRKVEYRLRVLKHKRHASQRLHIGFSVSTLSDQLTTIITPSHSDLANSQTWHAFIYRLRGWGVFSRVRVNGEGCIYATFITKADIATKIESIMSAFKL